MRFLVLPLLKLILKSLARLTLRRYQPGVVGVTGSVGKTSVKAAIYAVLSPERRVRASLKSFNNELGLPLTVLGDWDSTEGIAFWFKAAASAIRQIFVKNSAYPGILVLEYGVQGPGDMDYLLKVAGPHIGVVTALGEIPVHVEFFAGPEALFKEKVKLVKSLPPTGFAVLNADDVLVAEMERQTRAHPVSYGFSGGSDVRITAFENRLGNDWSGIAFRLNYGGKSEPVKISGVLGRGHAYAAAAAASVGLIYGMNLAKIAEALSGYNPPPGRLRILKGIKESVIIDDTYNSSPTALHEALDTLRDLPGKRKIAVLGDMLELGKYTMQAHQASGKLAAKAADILFAVGVRGKFIAEEAAKSGLSKKQIFTFLDVHEAGQELQNKLEKGDLILVKGSQGVRMEKIVKEVMAEPAKAHELLVRQSRVWLRKRGLYG